MTARDIHLDTPVASGGADVEAASAVVVMAHGRGATASGMLQFVAALPTDDVAYVAPQAAENTWYPQGFMATLESNQPWLDSALSKIRGVLDSVLDYVDASNVVFLGFSQGACLVSEFVARNATGYGGVIAFSGGLIGPDGTPREYDGDLAGTPVFLGCDEDDPHIPIERVHETATVFGELGGNVIEEIYRDLGHGVNDEELEYAADIIAQAR